MEIRKVYMSKVNARKLASLHVELKSKLHDLEAACEKLAAATMIPRGRPREWDLRVVKLKKEVKKLCRKISRITVTAQVSPAIAQEITKEREG